MKRVVLFGSVAIIIVMGILSGCSIAENKLGKSDNPVPVLTAISPDAKVSHMPSFTLTVTGSDLGSDSVIVFNGVEKTTTYVDSGTLNCEIEPGDIDPGASTMADAGMSDASLPVLVRNPPPGGGDSGTLNFTVYENHSFSPGVTVAEGEGIFTRPSIDVDDAGYIGIACEFYPDSTALWLDDVVFIGSQDGGGTWSAPVTIDQSDQPEFYPVLVLDNRSDSSGSGAGVSEVDPSEGINVAYNRYSSLYFSRSVDGGGTWSTPHSVNSTPSVRIVQPHMAVDSEDGLNLVFNYDDTTGECGARILFSRSLDNGVTWSDPVDVYNEWTNAGTVYNHRLAVDAEGGVYATWTEWPCEASRYSYVYTNYSHDHGETWYDEDEYFGVGDSSDVAVAPDGTVGLIVQSAFLPFQYNLEYHDSMDRGVSWSAPIEAVPGDPSDPLMVIDRAGNINVVYNVYYAYKGCSFVRSTDGGATWSTPVLIAEEAKAIDMAVDYWGNVLLVWENGVTGDITFSRTM